MGKIKRTVPNVSWCWWILSIRAQCLIQIRQLLPRGLLYLTTCFHLFWKNILSAMYVDWGPPHLNLVVLYISPTDTSSMQNLILKGLQQKLQKSCSRCNENTRHIESSYLLQPPKYLLLFVNRFRYINNNITKDRCPIPMDTTVRLGPLKFCLQATIDHHGPFRSLHCIY